MQKSTVPIPLYLSKPPSTCTCITLAALSRSHTKTRHGNLAPVCSHQITNAPTNNVYSDDIRTRTSISNGRTFHLIASGSTFSTTPHAQAEQNAVLTARSDHTDWSTGAAESKQCTAVQQRSEGKSSLPKTTASSSSSLSSSSSSSSLSVSS